MPSDAVLIVYGFFVAPIVVTFFEVNAKFFSFRLHHFDVAPRVAMHLLVALVAKHDAVAYRLPKFGES